MSKDFRATIRRESKRAGAWLEVFGSYEIPLKSPVPELASAPGVPVDYFYQLDVALLTPDQRERLIAFIAQNFHLEALEVSETLDMIGCPILASEITITVFNPLKWI